MALLLSAALGGCSAGEFSPVDWWHGLEGGRIAEPRPPPPNADAPYPTLGTVPARPPPPDAALHARLAGGLVADRTNAQYAATAEPLPAAQPSAASRRPLPAPPAPDNDQPNASLQAASAAPPAGVMPAPSAAPQSVPVPQPAPVAAPAPARRTAPPQAAAPAADAAMPEAPPAPPSIAGVAIPAFTRAVPPPATPPPPPPGPAVLSMSGWVAIPFPPGSAVLPSDALGPIKLLARRRAGASIAVTGFGDASSTDTAVQSAALPLALSRARAVAASLFAAGVPSNAVRVAAEPLGTGAAARLVN